MTGTTRRSRWRWTGAICRRPVWAGGPSPVTVTTSDGAAGTTPTVHLSASPNPMAEGSSMTVTARLSAQLSNSLTIPLTLTDGSAEPTDHAEYRRPARTRAPASLVRVPFARLGGSQAHLPRSPAAT